MLQKLDETRRGAFVDTPALMFTALSASTLCASASTLKFHYNMWKNMGDMLWKLFGRTHGRTHAWTDKANTIYHPLRWSGGIIMSHLPSMNVFPGAEHTRLPSTCSGCSPWSLRTRYMQDIFSPRTIWRLMRRSINVHKLWDGYAKIVTSRLQLPSRMEMTLPERHLYMNCSLYAYDGACWKMWHWTFKQLSTKPVL